MINTTFPSPYGLRKDRMTAGYFFNIPHTYLLGGFQLFPSAGIELDALGLNWVRTFTLWSERVHVGYRMIHPEDLHEVVGHHYPTDEQVMAIYGKPVTYESVPEHLKKRWAKA